MNSARTFSFFYREAGFRLFAVIALLFLAGLAEAFGIMAFFPFLQIVLDGQAARQGEMSSLGRMFYAIGLEPDFKTVSFIIITAISIKALILWLSMRYVSHAVAEISSDLRLRLMRALLKAQWKFFTENKLGVIVNAIIMETYRSSVAFLSGARFLSSLIQFSVYALAALLVSWKVFLGGLIIGSLLVFMLWVLVSFAKNAGLTQTVTSRKLLASTADMLQGIRPLRAMALEMKFLGIVEDSTRVLKDSQRNLLLTRQALKICHEPLMVLSVVIGVFLVTQYTDVATSELALIGILFMRMLTGLNTAQSEYQGLMVEQSALWALLDTIEETERASDNWPGHGDMPGNVKSIRFKNVSFSHGEHEVLKGIDMEFGVNQMAAIVGSSGSGKTTALDIMSGFYVPLSGQVLVNDQNLSEISLKSWRKTTGFVPQDVFLFNDSVLENILVGRTDYSEKDVWQALKAAGAEEFVKKMDGGLHAAVGENGRKLSGGQRQRIAIARAIIHKPQVLLLDEATSALDPETEKKILQTLKKLSKDMIVICVSHNMAVLEFADKVYKIRAGSIADAEEGQDAV